MGVPLVIDGDNPPSLVGIGLTDLPVAPLPPPPVSGITLVYTIYCIRVL